MPAIPHLKLNRPHTPHQHPILKIIQQGHQGRPDDPPRLLMVSRIRERQLQSVFLERPEPVRDQTVPAALEHLRDEQRGVVEDLLNGGLEQRVGVGYY